METIFFMSQLPSSFITRLDFEISSICNAGCSVCPRRHVGNFTNFKQTYWSIEEVKRAIDIDIIKNLSSIVFCGNFGDAMGNPDVVKIVKYFRDNNKQLKIYINTNGGIGDAIKYEQLAKMNVGMVFGIDGIGEVNELYRVNVKWEKIIENITSYIKYANSSMFEIQFLMWAETINQIIPMIDFMKSLGKGIFWLRKPFTTGEKTVVFNMNGEYTHYLTETDDKRLEKYFDTYWRYDQLDELKKQFEELNPTTKELGKGNMQKSAIAKFKEKPYEHTEFKFTDEELNEYEKINEQTCFSKNYSNPKNLTGKNYNVFITYDKLLMPCCMIPPNISNSIHHHHGHENSVQKEILNKMYDLGFESFSLKEKTLKEVFDTGVLDRFVYDDLEKNDPLKICKQICGKCV